MATILFLQDIPFEYMGPMYLSALLKKHGHQCQLMILSERKKYLSKISFLSPDLIAFSAMTGPHKKTLEIARRIKEQFGIPIILGGPHPTFFPEIISHPAIDIICMGEGEYALLELANAIREGKNINQIRNLWVKQDGKIHKNVLRPLIDNLDELPYPDRSLYDDCKIINITPARKFMTGRGCPHKCTFCFNDKYNQIYKGLGRVVRKVSPEYLINDIKTVAQKYPLKLVRFPDDSFIGSKKWLKEFLPRYKHEIDLPFTGLARANELDEDVVKLLKECGCRNIFFGVETGNESLRNLILKKNLDDKEIIRAASLLKRYGIKFGTYNMFGLPNETLDMAFQTIEINQKIKSDYVDNTLFQPYPGTEISAYAIAKGFLNPDFEYLHTMNTGSVINNPEIDQIVNLQRFAYLAIKYPPLFSIIKWLIKLPPNRLFKAIYDLCSINVMKSNMNLTWKNILIWGLKLRGIN